MRSLRPAAYGSVIAGNLRAARAAANLSQSDVGERMKNLGYAAWLRSTMSLAEQGKRRVTAEELLGLALALETSVVRLAAPSDEKPWIELPAGGVVHGAAVRAPGEVHWNGNEPRYTRQTSSGWVDQMSAAKPVVVAAIATSAEGILVTRRRDGVPPWGFLTGEVEPGESPEDAAIRECKEEAGLLVRAGAVIGERDHPQTGRHMIYMAVAPTHGTAVHVGDEAELAEVRWVSLAEAGELLPGMFEPVHDYLAGLGI